MAEAKGDTVSHRAIGAPETALVRGLKEWDPAAIGELYDRFGPSVLAFALAWFPRDQQLAEDIMVHSLANAVLHIRRYDPRRSSLGTWLHAIARRQIHDELRARRRRKFVPASAQAPLEAAVDIADGRDVAADSAAHVDAQRFVSLVATELSALEYDVLVLSCLGEFSAGEIGRVVGRSERAVHSLLHRAKSKARERLMKDER